MFSFAVGSLIGAIIGLCALFTLKYVELRRGVQYLPRVRSMADTWARILKAILRFFLMRIEQLPQDFAIFLRMIVHIGAIVFARGARSMERGAFNLADRVSYKHRFERGESRSEFLKSVSEHKNNLEITK